MTGGNCEKCEERCLVSSRKTYHLGLEVVQRIYIFKLITNVVSCLHQTKRTTLYIPKTRGWYRSRQAELLHPDLKAAMM